MPSYPDDPSMEITAALGSIPSGTPASLVARRLLDLFTGGSIAPGTRLPAERQLSATLGVGRSAVREALAALEILGIVDVRPGSGTYLRGTASELLPSTLRWGLLIGEHSTIELLELRSGLEIYVARLAATRADDAARATLRAHLDRMRASTSDLRAFAREDLGFHNTLAESAGNATLIDQLHVVTSLLRVYADRAVQNEDEARAAVQEHEAVFLAVAQHDEDRAAAAMALHMKTASSRLLRA